MDFQSIKNLWQWTAYSGQSTNNVTYIYVLNHAVSRLRGQSDILYVGETTKSIVKRYKQETGTKSTGGNTQLTNIRLTNIFGALGLSNVSCYFVDQMTQQIPPGDSFLSKLQVWDKKRYLEVVNQNPISVSLEKYLLVTYAADHLEVPPLNNRV